MRRCIPRPWAFSILTAIATTPANAADWVTLQASEPADADKAKIRPHGFVQVSAEGYAGPPISAARQPAFAAFEGQYPVFNTVDGQSPWGLLLRRVRAGVRGNIPGTAGLASLNISAELGMNPVTLAEGAWRPKLLDASFTYQLPADLSVRVGRFKAPLADESLEAVHVTLPLIRFSRVISQLLMERDAHGGTFAGTVDGFRDTGVQLAGSHLFGAHELSWAIMGGTASVEFAAMKLEPNLSARVQYSHLLDVAKRRQAKREAIEGWAFGSYGLRDVEGDQFDRSRAGVGGQARWHGVRLRSELIYGEGVLAKGVVPPFAGNPKPVSAEGKAFGFTGLATYRVIDGWDFGLSYSHLDREFDAEAARRIFDDAGLVVEAAVTPKLWFVLNVGLRLANAPGGTDATQALLDTHAPYFGLQATASL